MEDVRHYLSDEPVQACAPSASYRLHRFVRRDRAALVTSALVALALLVGTAAATHFALRAAHGERRARQKAVEAQAHAQRANQAAKRARDEKLLSDRRWYVAEMNLAQQEWPEGRMDSVQQHLQALEPKRPEDPDLRGFDWYYLRRLGQWQDLRTLRQLGMVTAVAFSPDGRRLATASSDQTVKLQDLITGQGVLTLHGHAAAVNAVAFSPDGRQLASASGHRTIRLWDARPLTPELRVLREAQGVVVFLFARHLPVAEVLDRIYNNLSLSDEVRCRALELAEPYGQSLVTQQAERVVNELYNKAMLRPEVLESLRTDASLGEPVRQHALALAQQIPESPISLHNASWNMVRRPGAEAAAYRLALMQAEVACRLMPNDGYYLQNYSAGSLALLRTPRRRSDRSRRLR